MLMESDKIMFEVYKEAAYTGRYRVVYFTELNEQNKEFEINRALAGEHFYDGFIKNYKSEEAKEVISRLIDRMNSGESITPEQFEQAIAGYIPPAVSNR